MGSGRSGRREAGRGTRPPGCDPGEFDRRVPLIADEREDADGRVGEGAEFVREESRARPAVLGASYGLPVSTRCWTSLPLQS